MLRIRFENRSDAIFNIGFYIVCALVALALGWELWRMGDDMFSPVVRLRRDEWTCTASHNDPVVFHGRFRSGAAATLHVCDQYSRRGH